MGHKQYGIGVDTWSLGCIFAELYTGKALFTSKSELHCLFKIFQHLGTPDAEVWPGVHKVPYFNMKFPKFRAKGFSYLRQINSDFDEIAHDLLVQMLKLNPNQRLNLEQVLSHPYFKKN
jgi:serine/threonine protein kinase